MDPYTFALLIDGLAVGTYFALILTVGLWPSRKQSTMEEFAMGGRSMPWWAVMASILAAEVSAATFIGAPQEGFNHQNFTYVQLAIGTVLARVVVAYLFIKPFYDYNVFSIYEFLEIRFGRMTKDAASALFLVTRVIASGARLYIAAVIIVVLWEYFHGNEPLNWQEQMWLYAAGVLFIALVTTVYTAIGGIRAVVWTDVIQAAMMYGGLFAATWFLLGHIGGWQAVTTRFTGPNQLTFFDYGIKTGPTFWDSVTASFKYIALTDYTLWTGFIAGTFMTMATHGTDQDMVQRMLTAKDHKRSRMAVIASGLMDIPVVLGFLVIGILLAVYYQMNNAPYIYDAAGKVKGNIFAYFIVNELGPGLRGLLLAGIFATAMGSLSTALNALATSFTRDWYQPYLKPGATEQQMVQAVSWSTAVFAVFLAIVGFITAYIALKHPETGILPIIFKLTGYTYGSLLGVFLLGLMCKTRGSDRGNLIGMVSGIIAVAILLNLSLIAFPWAVMCGTLVTLGVSAVFPAPMIPPEKLRGSREADDAPGATTAS
ncbi:MAG: sodium/solute symporter [Candidatus Methylacidiphilales bacterium]